MPTLAHEGAITGVAAAPGAARLAQAGGGVGALAVGCVGAALMVGFVMMAAPGALPPSAAQSLELNAALRGVASGDGIRVAGLRFATAAMHVDCRAVPVRAGRLNIAKPVRAVQAGGGLSVRAVQLWRTGRMQGEAGELSPLSAGIGRGDFDPGARLIGPGLSALGYSPVEGEGGGAATFINLPALWLAVPLPDVFIGEALAAVAMARGEPVVCRYSQGTTVAGRKLVNGSGAVRLFASAETFATWRDKALADLAAQVGGLAVRSGSERAAWVNAVRETNAGRARVALNKAERASGAAERAALVADAAFIAGRV